MSQAPTPHTVVLGAGAWGTALAIGAARHGATRVTLWARDPQQAGAIAERRENTRYLPGLPLPDALSVAQGDVAPLLADAQLVVVATPMAALREWLTRFDGLAAPVAWLCKGFERARADDQPGLLGHEIAAAVAPALRTGVLSGPSFAQEVARGQPTALVAASHAPVLRAALVLVVVFALLNSLQG